MTFDEKVYHSIQVKAVKKTIELRKLIKNKREQQLDKVSGYLQRTFKKQIDEIIDKRQQYELENVENKNSALINQMNANLIDTEVRRDERLMLVERQRNIGMEPPKLLMQLELSPNGQMSRLVSTDFKEIVEQYEKENGRSNFKVYKPFALVDFYSERFNGEPRFIIVTNQHHYSLSEDHIEDLGDILDKVYIYVVENGDVIVERAMAEEVFTFKQ
jgi:hypothetical protein